MYLEGVKGDDGFDHNLQSTQQSGKFSRPRNIPLLVRIFCYVANTCCVSMPPPPPTVIPTALYTASSHTSTGSHLELVVGSDVRLARVIQLDSRASSRRGSSKVQGWTTAKTRVNGTVRQFITVVRQLTQLRQIQQFLQVREVYDTDARTSIAKII